MRRNQALHMPQGAVTHGMVHYKITVIAYLSLGTNTDGKKTGAREHFMIYQLYFRHGNSRYQPLCLAVVIEPEKVVPVSPQFIGIGDLHLEHPPALHGILLVARCTTLATATPASVAPTRSSHESRILQQGFQNHRGIL